MVAKTPTQHRKTEYTKHVNRHITYPNISDSNKSMCRQPVHSDTDFYQSLHTTHYTFTNLAQTHTHTHISTVPTICIISRRMEKNKLFIAN